jgi:hypothetical protein
MAPGKPRGAPGENGGQLPESQRTRSRRKASRPYRTEPGLARTGNRGGGARGGEGKGEEARLTVNSVARLIAGRAGDVDPRRCWFRSLRFGAGDERAESLLRTEGRLRRAGKRPGDGTSRGEPATGSRDGSPRNGTNPRVGSALQYTRTASEAETVEVVGNHEDGTRTRGGTRVPKGVPRGPSGSGLRCRQDDGGAIFGNPRRGSPDGRPSGPTETGGAGKDGAEGHEGCADEG